MRQPVFETLITFIISQNNNIPRISGIVERLCDNFGEDRGGYRDFPSAETLSELSTFDLAPIRAGFRDKYIIDAARNWVDGTVREEFLKTAPLDSARDMLMKIKGVGPKVADCVLLFSANRLETFPKDVWIKRAMESLFPDGLPECAREYAGIAQQYIFHYARNRQII
jgi:N-glycosylase/DNA lyase